MIASKDRSGWFGASDTHTILGNWKTKTFANWWMEKLGFSGEGFKNKAVVAGTWYEHRILDSLGIPLEYDKQILIPELKLRVNLDGNDDTTDYEVKTYNATKGFKVPKQYIEQVNVQMYASGLKGQIISYGLLEEDYTNYFNKIEKYRLASHEIRYDKAIIEEWLKRIKYLAFCLDKGKFPKIEEFERWKP